MKAKVINSVAIGVLILIGLYFHFHHLTSFPRYQHAWAQADHLALSLGFLHNGFDLFHPETFHYNPQYPELWLSKNESTITAVDFPIHNYVVALFMKAFSTTSPIVFRIYLLIYSIIGLFFFFKFSREIGNSDAISFLLLLIAATSPVFVYYQAGFLPSIPCTANTLIAFYFMIVHFKKGKKKDFVLMLLFFMLATLSRTSYAVPLIALLCYELYNLIIRKQVEIYKWLLLGFSALLIVGYALYNSHLRSMYGSVFLSEPMPASDIQEFFQIVNNAYNKWRGHFFNPDLIWFFILIPLIPFLNYFVFKSKNPERPSRIWFYYLIWVFGILCFASLMIHQFSNHDYYFIDTFYLPIIVGLSISLSYISLPVFRFSNVVYAVLVIVVTFSLFTHARSIITIRDEDSGYDEITPVTDNFKGSKEFLDSLGIPRDAKILVLESVTPNIPFILMDRKGYTSMRMEKDPLNKLLRWDYDYVIIQNEVFTAKTYRLIPESVSHLKRVGGNNILTVCTYDSVSNPQSLKDLFGLDSIHEIAHFYNDFEQDYAGPWIGTMFDSTLFYHGRNSAVVPYNYEFGLEFKSCIKDLPRIPESIFVNSYIYKYADIDFEMVFLVKSGDSVIYQRIYSLNRFTEQKMWQSVNLYFSLPKNMPENAEISLYVYNHSGNQIYFDDFQCSFY